MASSRASEVTRQASMPQGTIHSNGCRSLLTLIAKPWVVTPRRVKHAGADEELVEAICTANFKQHFVPPDPKDPDFKKRCGYRCEDDSAKP